MCTNILGEGAGYQLSRYLGHFTSFYTLLKACLISVALFSNFINVLNILEVRPEMLLQTIWLKSSIQVNHKCCCRIILLFAFFENILLTKFWQYNFLVLLILVILADNNGTHTQNISTKSRLTTRLYEISEKSEKVKKIRTKIMSLLHFS